MRTIFRHFTLALLSLILISCSAISRGWLYTTKSEGWTIAKGYMAYISDPTPKAIVVTANAVGPYAVIVGPMFLPIVYPTCLQFWAKPDYTLRVDCTYNLNGAYTIFPQSVHFTDNEGRTMTPTRIACVTVGAERHLYDLDSTAMQQGVKVYGAVELQWFFKGKQAKVKGFSVLMDAPPASSNGGRPLLIQFWRRTYYKYDPLVII